MKPVGHVIKGERPTVVVSLITVAIVLIISLFTGLLTPPAAEGITALMLSVIMLFGLFFPLAAPMTAMVAAMGATLAASASQIHNGYTISTSLLTIIIITLIGSGLMLGCEKRRKKLASMLPLAFTVAGMGNIFYDNIVVQDANSPMATGLFGIVLLFLSPWLLGRLAMQQQDIRKAAQAADQLQQTTMQLEQVERGREMTRAIQNSVSKELKSIIQLTRMPQDPADTARVQISEESKKALNAIHKVINLLDSQQGSETSNHCSNTIKGQSHAANTDTQVATARPVSYRPAAIVRRIHGWHKRQRMAQSTIRISSQHANRDITNVSSTATNRIRSDKLSTTVIAIGVALVTVSGIAGDPGTVLSTTVGQTIVSDLLLLSAMFLPTGGAIAAFVASGICILIPGTARAAVFILAIASGILLGYLRRNETWGVAVCAATSIALYYGFAMMGRGGIGTILMLVLMYINPVLIGRFFRIQENLNQTMRNNEKLETKTAQLDNARYNSMLAEAIHDSITNELSSIILLTDDVAKPWTAQTLHTVNRKASGALGNINEVVKLLNGEKKQTVTSEAKSRDIREWLVNRCAQEDSSLHALGYSGISTVRGDLVEGRKINAKAVETVNRLLSEIYTNIIRHARSGIDGYVVVVELGEGQVRITETNDYSDPVAGFTQIAHGKGLELHQQSIEALGGTMETVDEDGSWIVNCTIPLVLTQ
ncbi:hypothetical protein [Bifidobacterium sp. ESL0732]|uniref:hypothetical protein n=1 Tax=Bifidobacterium sp. ESL0732 TaxID=2983222 RepID=UPI0023F62C9D|nr:hypothetical protein [Bifidobacterium sp. ESL0732]WEV64031.1 hypothetical protein OZX70_00010 [Bifidobacterium sp. ESL0732]